MEITNSVEEMFMDSDKEIYLRILFSILLY